MSLDLDANHVTIRAALSAAPVPRELVVEAHAALDALIGRIQELEEMRGAAQARVRELEAAMSSVSVESLMDALSQAEAERDFYIMINAASGSDRVDVEWAARLKAEAELAIAKAALRAEQDDAAYLIDKREKAEAERDTLRGKIEMALAQHEMGRHAYVGQTLRAALTEGAACHRTVSSEICNRSVATESYAHDHSYLAERAEMAEADCDRLWVALREIADLARAATAQGAGE